MVWWKWANTKSIKLYFWSWSSKDLMHKTWVEIDQWCDIWRKGWCLWFTRVKLSFNMKLISCDIVSSKWHNLWVLSPVLDPLSSIDSIFLLWKIFLFCLHLHLLLYHLWGTSRNLVITIHAIYAQVLSRDFTSIYSLVLYVCCIRPNIWGISSDIIFSGYSAMNNAHRGRTHETSGL